MTQPQNILKNFLYGSKFTILPDTSEMRSRKMLSRDYSDSLSSDLRNTIYDLSNSLSKYASSRTRD